MARPVSATKLGFYPTPPRVVDLIKTVLRVPLRQWMQPGTTLSVLDNFAGQGAIACQLAEHLGGTPWLVELDKERAATCTEYLTDNWSFEGDAAAHVLNAPAESVEFEGGLSVWIFNPPYDHDRVMGRQEIYLWHATVAKAAKPGALCILILPAATVARPEFAREIYRWISKPICRKFPEPEYQTFKQVIVMGYARPAPIPMMDVPVHFPELSDLINPWRPFPEAVPTYDVPSGAPISNFRSTLPNWDEISSQTITHGVRTGTLWAEFMRAKSGAGAFMPLVELGDGKAALMTAAGMANGTVIDGQVLKGATRTYIETFSRDKPGEDGRHYEQVIEREVYAQTLTLLHLTTGSLTLLDSHDTHEQYTEYILAHTEDLIANIRAKYPPLFDGDLTPWLDILSRLEGPKSTAGLPPGLLPRQQLVACAVAKRLKTASVAFVVGEQGTGKTTTMIAGMMLANAALVRSGEGFKCVVMGPGHLTKKWKREVLGVVRRFGAKCVIIGEERMWAGGTVERRPLMDVQRAMAEPGVVFLILSKETAKMGSPWAGRAQTAARLVYRQEVMHDVDGAHAVSEREVLRHLVCPHCGKAVTDDAGAPLFTWPRNKKGKEESRFSCYNCQRPLYTHGEADGSFGDFWAFSEALRSGEWMPVPPRTFERGKRALPVGFRRVAVAEYISQHYQHRYRVILDEAHQYKAEDSDQAYAAVDLIAGAVQVIEGTGTIYGGRATTLFHILYRAIPWFRTLYQHDEAQKFAEHFGLIETTFTSPATAHYSDSSMGYQRNDDWRMTTKEIPGAHPAMAAFMLPYAAFMRLADMGVVMPGYFEERVPVPLPEGIGDRMISALGSLQRRACTIEAQGWSAFMHAALGWVDLPNEETFTFKDKTEGQLPRFTMPDGQEWPKVKIVSDMILADRNRDRRSIIYLSQVHRRNAIPLYTAALERRGLTSYVLDSTTKGDEREDLINTATNAGVDVLLCNGSLVETGLDLVYFCNIFRVQPITSYYQENQQDRRIWRFGQLHDCYIYWVYYDYAGSVQALTVSLMARKLRAALLLNGDLAEGLATTEDNNDSFLQEMLRLLQSNAAPSWDNLPGVATPATVWTPAWEVPFNVWATRRHDIVDASQGRIYIRPGARPVVWPAGAALNDVVAWQYRNEVLQAKNAGLALPEHALAALAELPPLPNARKALALPPVAAPKPPALPPVIFSQKSPGDFSTETPKAVPVSESLSLRSLGNGQLELRTGGAPVRLNWLGGDRLNGPSAAVRTVRERFRPALIRNHPMKRWSAQA